ncbi:MAG: hypothetical protein WBJ35_08860 [Acetomicrobium sp.]
MSKVIATVSGTVSSSIESTVTVTVVVPVLVCAMAEVASPKQRPNTIIANIAFFIFFHLFSFGLIKRPVKCYHTPLFVVIALIDPRGAHFARVYRYRSTTV